MEFITIGINKSFYKPSADSIAILSRLGQSKTEPPRFPVKIHYMVIGIWIDEKPFNLKR